MTIEPIKNRIRSSQQFRGENERSDGAVACSFTNAAESATNLQRTPAAAYTTRRDATRRDGTGPTTRSIETTRLDELAADQLLSRMLIIVLEAFSIFKRRHVAIIIPTDAEA